VNRIQYSSRIDDACVEEARFEAYLEAQVENRQETRLEKTVRVKSAMMNALESILRHRRSFYDVKTR
jgi:hypothetical protein